MNDRKIVFRENQRHIVRGLSWNAYRRRVEVDLERDETEEVTLDFSALGTVSSVATPRVSGITATATEADNIVTLTLSNLAGAGDVDLKVTFSTGRVRIIYIRARSAQGSYIDDYGVEYLL